MEKILFAPGLCQTRRVLHRALPELPVRMAENKPKSKTLFLQSVYTDRIWMWGFFNFYLYVHKCSLSLTGQIWELLFSYQTPPMDLKTPYQWNSLLRQNSPNSLKFIWFLLKNVEAKRNES